MKRKLKSDRGFTLAELLIVVAIIGVLVAIAIPIFTSQLERSREAVDLSDVRSAYAEVMMAAITGDTSATYTKDSGQKIYKEMDGTYSIMVTPLKQQKDDWQTPLPITIGGVSSNAGDTYWKGIPGPKGYCEITYHPLNRSPSSRQLKKYKFFLPAEIYLLAVFMRLASKFRVFPLVLKFRDSFVSVYYYSNLYNLRSFLREYLYQ